MWKRNNFFLSISIQAGYLISREKQAHQNKLTYRYSMATQPTNDKTKYGGSLHFTRQVLDRRRLTVCRYITSPAVEGGCGSQCPMRTLAAGDRP
jgi:hypothetical protein